MGLGGNEIHDEGVQHLADALKTNTNLKSLGLGGNLIGQFTVVILMVIIINYNIIINS